MLRDSPGPRVVTYLQAFFQSATPVRQLHSYIHHSLLEDDQSWHILEQHTWKSNCIQFTFTCQFNINKKLLQLCPESVLSYPNVPITRVDRCVWRPSGASLARPKSETLAWKLFSSKILDALKSRWMTQGCESSCKYASPLAASRAIFILDSQSKAQFNPRGPETNIIHESCMIKNFYPMFSTLIIWSI